MAAHPIPAIQDVAERVGDHMDAILKLFKPGAKIVVLVRQPEFTDGSRDFLLTNDKLDDAITALQIRNNPAVPTFRGDV